MPGEAPRLGDLRQYYGHGRSLIVPPQTNARYMPDGPRQGHEIAMLSRLCKSLLCYMTVATIEVKGALDDGRIGRESTLP